MDTEGELHEIPELRLRVERVLFREDLHPGVRREGRDDAAAQRSRLLRRDGRGKEHPDVAPLRAAVGQERREVRIAEGGADLGGEPEGLGARPAGRPGAVDVEAQPARLAAPREGIDADRLFRAQVATEHGGGQRLIHGRVAPSA
jgi:hypothetical protein